MQTRFKKNAKVADIMITSIGGTLSVVIMLYGIYHFVIDALIAAFYHFDIMYFEAVDEYTNYMLTEIWIRPTITYGLVACFLTETGSAD